MAEGLRSKKEFTTTRRRKRSLASPDEAEMVSKSLSVSDKVENDSQNDSEEKVPDCAICLQTCIHPARLPCGHIFCFLCIKGVVHSGWRCAMCRAQIPRDYFDSPQLLVAPRVAEHEENSSEHDMEEFQWFYEGRHGWWRYDERANAEMEAAYNKSEDSITLLIAGYLYEIDLIDFVQIRKSEPHRRRRVKRDLVSAPSKGVAGLREDLCDLASGLNRLVLNEDLCSANLDD